MCTVEVYNYMNNIIVTTIKLTHLQKILQKKYEHLYCYRYPFAENH